MGKGNANEMSKAGLSPQVVDLHGASVGEAMALPLSFQALSAGFPSAALDFDDVKIDLNRELIRHPASTFFGRVRGTSMQDAGIGDGDLLVIDKSLDATHGRVAVCFIDGEFTVKRIHIDAEGTWLMAANPAFAPIKVLPTNDFQVWGIVTFSIKSHT